RGAVLLIYAGMDTMAYLGMPAEQQEVKRDDFIKWAENYIRFPCKEQLSGEELYAARCATLHTYGTESRMNRKEAIRQLCYMNASIPEIRSAPTQPHLAIVSIPALAEAFFQGIDRFIVDLFTDSRRRPIAEARFQKIMHERLIEDL